MAVEKVLQEALALSRNDRARILEALRESLEPGEDWERAWAAEAARRMKAVDEGRAPLTPHDQVFAGLRAPAE